MRERIATTLGTRVSDRKLGDLMRLAHFQMLGREARAWRSPTAILARRPLRRARSHPCMCGGGLAETRRNVLPPLRCRPYISLHERSANVVKPVLARRGSQAA